MKHTASKLMHYKVQGNIAIVTLDRPLAYNAMNLEMVHELQDILKLFAADNNIGGVVIRSDHPKAFCAGGDVKAAYHVLNDPSKHGLVHQFFDAEYALNLYIAEYAKPYIAMIDGICMGGGMGVSIYARHRIVSERAVLAMPENLIGFTPDVGAFYFFNRINRAIGYYLSLTGESISGIDACHVGLSDHFVPHDRHPALLSALINCAPEEIADSIASFTEHLPPSELLHHQSIIEYLFDEPDHRAVINKLHSLELNEFTLKILEAINYAAPSSLALTDHRFVNEANFSLKEVLHNDAAYGRDIIFNGDFAEGVRALLVDKDRKPHWKL